eukprot:g8904.t1
MAQNGAGGGGALQETALSFTGVVTIVTFCCCSTMSCVALCIKLVSWMFGHRGRRRRVPRRPHERSMGEHEEERALHKSEMELRDVPFGNIEGHRKFFNKNGSGSSGAARASGPMKDGESELLSSGGGGGGGGSPMTRETTNGSTLTRTGTPSVLGEQERSYYSTSGSSHDEETDARGEDEAVEGHAAAGGEEVEEEEDAEHLRPR